MDTRVPLFSWGFSCFAIIARIEVCSPCADGRPEPSCALARHCPSYWLRFHFRRKKPRQLNIAPKPIIWRIFPALWSGRRRHGRKEKHHFWFAFSVSFRLELHWRKLPGGAMVHDRRIVIRWIRKPQELSACQILFVSHSEQKRYAQPCAGKRYSPWGKHQDFSMPAES